MGENRISILGSTLTDNQKIVFDLFVEAAAVNAPAPDNLTICDAISASSRSSAAKIVRILEDLDLIDVERFVNSRVVTIVATGAKTAWQGEKRTPARGTDLDAAKERERQKILRRSGGDIGGDFRFCQFIKGEASGRDFCGEPTTTDRFGARSTYCAHHHAICHTGYVYGSDDYGAARKIASEIPPEIPPEGSRSGADRLFGTFGRSSKKAGRISR